jgi:hypothetical protein
MMALTSVFAAALAAGCGDSGAEDDYRDRDRRGDERISERPRYDEDARPGREDLPRGAVVVDEGTSGTLRHEPAHSGRAFLYDADDRVVAYESRLRPGERLVINPADDSIKIDGVKDGKVNLRAKHQYRLYYLRDDRATDRDLGRDGDRDRRERY